MEVTNLVSDEDDDVDMKDELDQRHEGMSKRKCEHVRGPHIGCGPTQYVVFIG